jgi:archaellum component FlaC
MNDVAKAINHFSVLMEDQNAKLDAILEGQKDQATRADIQRLEQRLDVLENDVQAVKAAVKDASHDLKTHGDNERIHVRPHDAFGQRAAA